MKRRAPEAEQEPPRVRADAQKLGEVMASEAGVTAAALCRGLTFLDACWGRIVGDILGSRTTAVSYDSGILTVLADSQAAAHDFNFKKYMIAAKINEGLRIPVREIRVKLGAVRPTSARSGDAIRGGVRRARPAPAREPDAATVDRLTAEIMSRTEGINPALARQIARCRVLSHVI